MSRARTSTFTVFKDVTSYIGGWWLIVYQAAFVPPQDFNLWFLLAGGLLVGVPGFGQLLNMRISAGRSLSPAEGSPPPLPPSPSESGAER